MPDAAPEGILKGMYLFRKSIPDARPRVQLMGAGTILREVIAAAEMLERDWGVAADVWSVTSFSELRRDAMAAEREHRLRGDASRSWIANCLSEAPGPIVAASDYVRAVPDLIAPFTGRRFTALGTDGFGRSDTRAKLRPFFEVSREHIVIAALAALTDEGTLARATVDEAISRTGIDPLAPPPWTR